MQVRILPLVDVTAEEGRAWQDLASDAVAPNMCLDPRQLLAARHLGERVADLRLLVVTEGARWLAVLALTTKRVIPRLPVQALTTGGDYMTLESDRHHPLVRRGRAVEALDALLRGAPTVGLPGLALLRRFPLEGPLADALAEVVRRRRLPVVERSRETGAWAPREAFTVLDVPDPVDGVIVDPPLSTAHLRPGDAQKLRRVVRGITRETGEPIALHLEAARPDADDRFVELQSAGWKGDTDRGGAAVGLDPRREHWFRDAARAFREDGDLAVLRLAAGPHTLWTGYLARSGGGWFGMLDAYDERFRRFSPGSVGRVVAMTYLLGATDAPFVDPGFGSHYAVGARLWPAPRTQVDLLLPAGGLAAHALVRAVPLARRLGLAG